MLGQYTFGNDLDGATLSADSVAPPLTFSDIGISPTLIDGTSFTEAQSTGGNPDGRLEILDANTGNLADAITGDEYISFTITPGANPVSITDISFDTRAGGTTGTRVLALFVSTDGFATAPLATDQIFNTGDLGTSWSNFNGNPVLTNISSPISIRIYGYTDSASRSMNIDNLQVQGTVIPEPGTLALVVIAFAGLWVGRLRRRT